MNTVSKKSIIQLFVFLLIAGGLIYWQYTSLDKQQLATIKESLQNAKWHYLFLAVIVGFLSHLFRALRWNQMLATIDIRPPIATTTVAVLLGYLANILIPRLGEIIRCTFLNRNTKAPFDKSIGSVIAERLFDTLTLLVVFFLILFVEYNTLIRFATEIGQGLLDKMKAVNPLFWIIAIIILIICVILFFYFFKKIKSTVLGKIINHVVSGLKSIFLVKNKMLFLIYTILIWVCYITMTWLAFGAIGGTEHLGFGTAMAVTAFGSFAIILTPGGIGAYPPIVAAILAIYSIHYELGLAVGWFGWSMQTIVVLVLGLLAIIFTPFLKKDIANG